MSAKRLIECVLNGESPRKVLEDYSISNKEAYSDLVSMVASNRGLDAKDNDDDAAEQDSKVLKKVSGMLLKGTTPAEVKKEFAKLNKKFKPSFKGSEADKFMKWLG